MAKSNNQKAKILYLEKMLRETGEHRVISMQKILENLEKQGTVQSERAFMMMWRYYVLLEWISVIQENGRVGIILPVRVPERNSRLKNPG